MQGFTITRKGVKLLFAILRQSPLQRFFGFSRDAGGEKRCMTMQVTAAKRLLLRKRQADLFLVFHAFISFMYLTYWRQNIAGFLTMI